MDESGIVDTIEKVAKHFRKTPRTVYRWKDTGMPVMSDGRFDLFEITAWRRSKKGISTPSDGADVEVKDAPDRPVSAGKDIWDAKSKEYQAKLRELDLQERLKNLIDKKKNEENNIRSILEVKNLLLAYERLLPPELIRCKTDREQADVIRKFNRKILEKFVKNYEGLIQDLELGQRDNDAPHDGNE